jgi:hypothetical protein
VFIALDIWISQQIKHTSINYQALAVGNTAARLPRSEDNKLKKTEQTVFYCDF